MKNYSSNRAQKGKTAYRTPSMFKANKAIKSNVVRNYKKGKSVTGYENSFKKH